MVVDRSRRRCLLCDAPFTGRAFLCRDCAERYRRRPPSLAVRREFYAAIDRVYPDWSNTFREVNPPVGLLRYAATLPGSSRLLELGAGGGFTLETLRRLGFHDLIGSDLTASTVATMHTRLPWLPVVAADAEALPFGAACCDVLLSSDLIEHLPDLDAHLAEAARVLRPGGRYLIKTPNRLAAEAYYRLRGLYDAYFWHPSMCSPGELRAVLARHGFGCHFLPAPHLTAAQCRKIPVRSLRPLAARLPLSRLPLWSRPHLEVVATLNSAAPPKH